MTYIVRKQGCSLSTTLFDLALKQLIDSVNKDGYNFTQDEVAVLAYADGLCIIAETPKHLQEMLDWAQYFAVCPTTLYGMNTPHKFVKPKIGYVLRIMLPTKGWAQNIDNWHG